MITYGKDCQTTILQGLKGGTGEAQCLFSMTPDHQLGHTSFQMVGQITLPPGSSVGFHTHDDDEEIYLITSGTGIYTDTNGQAYPVVAGDLTLTRRGEGHSLSNNADQPLSFMAVIAT